MSVFFYARKSRKKKTVTADSARLPEDRILRGGLWNRFVTEVNVFSLCVLFHFGRCLEIKGKGNRNQNQNQINEEIRAKEIRVIDKDGNQLGVMSPAQALQIAAESKLDLVNVAPNAHPPVCRIMDYGKYRYEMQKKAKDARKKQKVTQVKEIRLSTYIEKHDLMVKANNALKFLKDGDKVKVSIRFRGRERGHTSTGEQVMQQFAEVVAEVGQIEKKPLLEGRSMTMILAPKKQ